MGSNCIENILAQRYEKDTRKRMLPKMIYLKIMRHLHLALKQLHKIVMVSLQDVYIVYTSQFALEI